MFQGKIRAGVALAVALCAAGTSFGQLSKFNDRAAFGAAVGSHTIIDFDDAVDMTALLVRYADFGVVFPDPNDMILSDPAFMSDGRGVAGNGRIEITFDEPQHAIAVDFPGALRIDLYQGTTHIGESVDFGRSGAGLFGGLASDVPFDGVVLSDWVDDFVAIDSLQFSTAPDPATLTLLGLGLAMRARRRR